MLSVLVPSELEESNVATEIGQGVIGLGVPETELEIWYTWEAPGGPGFSGELGRDPKLEDLGLVLEFVTVFIVVDGCEARDVNLSAIVVLANALGEEVASLLDLKNLIGRLDLGLLLVPKTTPREGCENQLRVILLRYSLSLLNFDGHTEETTGGDIVRGILALIALHGLFSDKYLLQLV